MDSFHKPHTVSQQHSCFRFRRITALEKVSITSECDQIFLDLERQAKGSYTVTFLFRVSGKVWGKKK